VYVDKLVYVAERFKLLKHMDTKWRLQPLIRVDWRGLFKPSYFIILTNATRVGLSVLMMYKIIFLAIVYWNWALNRL